MPSEETGADRLYRWGRAVDVPLPRMGGAATEDAGVLLRSGRSWSRCRPLPWTAALCADTDAQAGVIARPAEQQAQAMVLKVRETLIGQRTQRPTRCAVTPLSLA